MGEALAYDQDRMYLDLKGARERLCRAQTFMPVHWRSDAQAALDHIDQLGSSLCPEQWSPDDQPEYPEPKAELW